MLPKAEPGCFVIADISGYTSYLAGVELDHAQDIIADLMNTVVKCLSHPFRLAKFEGDAAFLCAAGDRFDGSLLLDAIESTYFAFRKRLRNIELATSCQCKACHGMQQLDLKFVSHHGEFVRQRMAGRDELAGHDVIVVHRLLKNFVKERLGERAYVLYSDPCMQAMGLDPVAQGLVEHREAVDNLGQVKCWLHDLDKAWKDEKERRRNLVTRNGSAMVIEFDIAAPRPKVWEYFTLPDQRPKWRAADEVRETPRGGRRGIGTVNHCMHGPHAVIEEVLDWRPFDYLTLATLLPMPGAPKVLMTYAFQDMATGGTHVEIRVAKPKPRDKIFVEQVGGEFQKNITREIVTLRQMLEAEGPDLATVERRTLPGSQERSPIPPAHAQLKHRLAENRLDRSACRCRDCRQTTCAASVAMTRGSRAAE